MGWDRVRPSTANPSSDSLDHLPTLASVALVPPRGDAPDSKITRLFLVSTFVLMEQTHCASGCQYGIAAGRIVEYVLCVGPLDRQSSTGAREQMSDLETRRIVALTAALDECQPRRATGLERAILEVQHLLFSYHIARTRAERQRKSEEAAPYSELPDVAPPPDAEPVLSHAIDAVEAEELVWIDHLLWQDIVLRLTKLDDDDSRSWSFMAVYQKEKKRAETKDQVRQMKVLLKEYGEVISHAKLQHRNTYIAHLAKTYPEKAEKPTDVRKAIAKAVEIVDVLAGRRVEYSSAGGALNLRAEFEKN